MHRKAVAYARYSTELQSPRSIEDQVELCRQFAAKNGFEVSAIYADRAQTGASLLAREGLLRLLADAKDGKFEVVIVEALDRLSRNQKDMASIHEQLSFLDIDIIAVHDGKADIVQVGIRSLIGAVYLEDLKHKVRRGMQGRVRGGMSPGGKAYGYRPVPGKAGELEIIEEEASAVRRIFSEFAAGKSPRDIAYGLNRDGVTPPRGEVWNASTINGSRTRQNGMLRNPIYGGEIVWNRLRMVRDPETGRRVSRMNPESEWQRVERPDLRIVDAETYEAVQARVDGRRAATGYRPRTPRMLSGLLRCASCGSGMTLDGQTDGKPRIRCSRARESGSCDHRRKYPVHIIERAVLDAVRAQLANPEALSLYIDTYIAERRRLALEATNNRGSIEAALARKKAEINRLIDLAVKGVIDADHLAERKPPLDADIKRLEAELIVAPPINAVELHPAALTAYKRDLGALARVIEEAAGEAPDGAILAPLRRLVDSVIIHPTPARAPIEVEIKGRLSVLMGEEMELPPARKKLAIGMVAEDRYRQSPHLPDICYRRYRLRLLSRLLAA